MDRMNAILKDLQAEDFAVYEASLYLDGHPGSKDALEYRRAHRAKALELREAYEAERGPLTLYGKGGGDDYLWVTAPWPWEKEAN